MAIGKKPLQNFIQNLKQRFSNLKNVKQKFSSERERLLLLDNILKKEALISVIVVLLSFLIGTIWIFANGNKPGIMYGAIWQSITGITPKGKFIPRYIGDTLCYVVPIILTGLSVAFAYRAGLFNIGAEGQYIVGMTTATVCAFYGPQVPIIHPLYCILMAVIFSAAFGGIVGFLKAKYEVSEVVATIMLNYMALPISRIITRALPAGAQQTRWTAKFPSSASIEMPFLGKIFGYPAGSRDALDFGLILALLAVVVYWFITEKTSIGYELRATGFNRNAALASGIPIKRSVVLSMGVAGAFAGLAGALVAIGSFEQGRIPDVMDNYGFQGIAVALIGNCKAIGILLSSYLFGILKRSQPLMQGRGVPKEVIYIIQGIIVVLISLRAVAVILRNSISKKLAKKGD